MFAYTWPLLSLFWTFLMFAGVVLLLFFVIFCFIDNFRRRDHHGWAKAMWTVVILLIPFLGCVAYIIARPADAQLAKPTVPTEADDATTGTKSAPDSLN